MLKNACSNSASDLSVDRQRYWIEPQKTGARNRVGGHAPLDKIDARTLVQPGENPDIADWFYVPLWKQSVALQTSNGLVEKFSWLMFFDECGLGAGLIARLTDRGQSVIIVRAG